MHTRPLIDWPRLRDTPRHLTWALRQVDEAAELLYMREGRWILGSVRWNRLAIAKAERIVERALHALSLHLAQTASKGMLTIDRRSRDRLEMFLLALQGFRPVAEYRLMGEPTAAIVDDFRRMDWLYRTTSDEQLFDALDAPQEAARAASRAELVDPYKATDAWRYLFTRSHAPGISLTPARVIPSSRTLHRAIA